MTRLQSLYEQDPTRPKTRLQQQYEGKTRLQLQFEQSQVTPGQKSAAKELFAGASEMEAPPSAPTEMPQPRARDVIGFNDPIGKAKQLAANVPELAVMAARDLAGTAVAATTPAMDPMGPIGRGQQAREKFNPALEKIDELAGGAPKDMLGTIARMAGPIPFVAGARSLRGVAKRPGAPRTAPATEPPPLVTEAEIVAPAPTAASADDALRVAAEPAARPVRAAAIKLPDGRIVEGQTHGHALLRLEEAGEQVDVDRIVSGFTTADGGFVDWGTGVRLAKEANQAKPAAGKRVLESDEMKLPGQADDYPMPPVPKKGNPKFKKLDDEAMLARRHQIIDRLEQSGRTIDKNVHQWSRYDDDIAETRSGTRITGAGGRAIGRHKDDGRILDEVDAELKARGFDDETIMGRYAEHAERAAIQTEEKAASVGSWLDDVLNERGHLGGRGSRPVDELQAQADKQGIKVRAAGMHGKTRMPSDPRVIVEMIPDDELARTQKTLDDAITHVEQNPAAGTGYDVGALYRDRDVLAAERRNRLTIRGPESGAGGVTMLTSITGAGSGAATGAVVDDENPVRGALVGAAAGLALGAKGGSALERRARQKKPLAPPYTGPVDPDEFVNVSKFALDPGGETRLRSEVDRIVRKFHIAPKQKVTWAETQKIAKTMGFDDLTKDQVGRLDGPKMLAIRSIVARNVTQLKGMYKKLDEGGLDEAQKGEIDQFIGRIEQQNDALLSRFVKNRSQTGRDLNNLKILANWSMDDVTWRLKAENILQQQGKTLTPEIRQKIVELTRKEDRPGLVKFVAGLRESSNAQKAVTIWKAGLLTSPTTHAANIFGNTTMAVLETAKDAPAAAVDWLISLGTGTRTKSFDPVRTAKASWQGAKQGVAEAKLVMQGVPLDDALQKWDIPKEVTFDNALLNAYTKGVFRSLQAEDRVFRGIALRRSLAEQLALNKGQLTDEIALQAIRDAEFATFQNQGMLSKAAMGFKRPLGAAGDIIVPFTRTPANIASRVVEYSPLGLLKTGADVLKLATKAGLTPAERRLLQKGASETAGRAAVGSLPIAAGYLLAKNGLMTGARPGDKTTRDEWQFEGKQENAVKVGGRWHTLQRISPIGNLMALGANLYTLTQTPDLTAGQVGAAAVGSIGTTVTEQSFLTGVQQMIEATRDPVGSAGRYATNLGASVVPSIVRRAAFAVDPTVRDARGLKETVQARIPFASKSLPARIDQFGQPVQRAGGIGEFIDPFASRRDRTADSPVIAALQKAGAAIGRRQQWPGESREAYQSRQIREGPALERVLGRIVESPRFHRLSGQTQEEALELVTKLMRTQFTRVAKSQ